MNAPPRQAPPIELPRVDRWLMGGFERHFLPRYLRKHFHVVAANDRSLTSAILDAQSSMVVYANHASWWDPMIAIFLRSRSMTRHTMYAPIDAQALEQYKIFKRMGFYGIAQGSRHGATEFLQRSLRITQSPTASLWLTPEGKFCDPRQREQPLAPGLAHLATTIANTAPPASAGAKSVWFIPAAIEYVFWEERLPECLCWFGTPVELQWHAAPTLTKSQWNECFTQHLREAQAQLAQASIARDTAPFKRLLTGKAGSWSLYDFGRKVVARARGKKVNMEHHQGIWS